MTVYTPGNRCRAQQIICEFKNSQQPIARVDWAKWNYSSFRSCSRTLKKSCKWYHEHVKVIVNNSQIYLIDADYIIDI